MQEPLLGRVGGQLQRTLVGDSGVAGPVERAEQFGAGGVEQVIVVQVAGQGVELGEGGGGAGDVAQGDRPVQAGHRRWSQVQQHVVEHDDLGPVGVLPPLGLRVAGDDRRLQLVRAGPTQRGGAGDEPPGVGDRRMVPSAAVLVWQLDEIARRGVAGGGAGPVQADKASRPITSGSVGISWCSRAARNSASSVRSRPGSLRSVVGQ